MNKKNLYFNLDSVPLTVTSLKDIPDPLVFPPAVTRLGFSKDISAKYTCPICQEVFTDPIVTTCECSTTMCRPCFEKNSYKCTICRKKTNCKPNEKVKKILSNQQMVCKCGKAYQYGNIEEHYPQCVMTEFNCTKCNTKCDGPGFVQHLFQLHYSQILNTCSKFISD
jgi:hypothetical protein